jgi:hypothetical protein
MGVTAKISSGGKNYYFIDENRDGWPEYTKDSLGNLIDLKDPTLIQMYSNAATAAMGTSTGKSYASMSLMKIPGTPVGMDIEGNMGISPSSMIDDESSGGFQINP